MSKQTEALKLALEALEDTLSGDLTPYQAAKTITAIREALAEQPAQPKCNPHPKAPHGFDRNASHSADRYVCECEGWDAYDAGHQAGFEKGLMSWEDEHPAQQHEHEFKNFHRMLCERFGYTHDERDWRRDQISLIEWIAKKVEQPAQQQEPFGYVTVRRLSQRFENHHDQYHFYPAGQSPYLDNVDECHYVYTSPPRKPWVGLTDLEMRELEKQFNAERVRTSDEEYLVIYPGDYWAWQRAIEAKLKEKNNG